MILLLLSTRIFVFIGLRIQLFRCTAKKFQNNLDKRIEIMYNEVTLADKRFKALKEWDK